MAYENTGVPVAKSQEGIRQLLLENGATGIAFVSQSDPVSEGFEAMIPIDGKTYRIRIAAVIRKVENNSKGRWYRGSYRARKTDAQVQETELRRVWRVLFYHLKSVYEASNSGVMEFRELVLPYVVVKDGRTIAQHLLPKLSEAIESRPERMLTAGA
jgi:hypothetical protein